jgi:uncharacterized UBP type Zn finger protein
VRSVVGGVWAQQRVGRGACRHYRSVDEEFSFVNLEVRGHDTLKSALDAYVKPEVISGFQCDDCGGKVTVFKQYAFKRLPPTLFCR